MPHMVKRLVQSALIAVTLAMAAQVEVAAKRPSILVCELPNDTEIRIVIENFDGMDAAVHQCLFFWGGKPHGVER